MFSYLQKMKESLTAAETAKLRAIYEPTVVTVPPCDACRHLTVMPDGEIRIYGWVDKRELSDPGTPIYLSSRDAGLSWRRVETASHALGSATRNPETGRWISTSPNEFRRGEHALTEGGSGSYAILSDEGPDSECLRAVKLAEEHILFLRKPLYLHGLRRWLIFGQHRKPDFEQFVEVFVSDDDGEHWMRTRLPHAPAFEVTPPHKSPRWQEYSCEPTVADMGDGRLLMLVRTSQNYHYMHESQDGGLTWSAPTPSPFHATLTMPTLLRLSDGRVVLFHCNTQPLPEIDKEAVFPRLSDNEKRGIGEDVFTNRDANHLAITEDGGKTWRGERELYLNFIRNFADFRAVGGRDSHDKSVHQAELLELPYNKLLVAFGQNAVSRKVVILDLDWLYETKRREDFREGLATVSTQMYVKSNLGGFAGWSGHCAYNRTDGALLVPDPSGNRREVLQLCRTDDPRLVYQKQGVVWNFPADKRGRVRIELMVVGSGVAISLTDRWYNPVDETVKGEASLSLAFDRTSVTPNEWHAVDVLYDTEKGSAEILLDGASYAILPLRAPAPLGLSYLHVQTLAEKQDFEGTLLRLFEKAK